MSLNLATILRESAKRFPERNAIVVGEAALPYAVIDGFARRFAGALKSLGVRPGQHVALMLPNVPQFTIAYFGGHYAATPIVHTVELVDWAINGVQPADIGNRLRVERDA